VQVVTVLDVWPIWTSDVRPGREHDTTAVRTHPEILPALTEIPDDLRVLGDLGYEGEADTITVAFKTPHSISLAPSNGCSTPPTTGSGPSGNAVTPC